MRNPTVLLLLFTFFYLSPFTCLADSTLVEKTDNGSQASVEQVNGTTEMLSSLLELQQSLKEQMSLSRKKYENSQSEAEKNSLELEISNLDRQLSETVNDFERIATGVEPSIFSQQKVETFSWKKELANLVEPVIKELKRFTVRARQKTELKDKIAELNILSAKASQAVEHLQTVLKETPDKKVGQELRALLPEWHNAEKRLRSKLELAERELVQLNAQDVSLVESSKNSVRNFFRDRGRYLAVAIITFIAILLSCRVIYRLLRKLYSRMNKGKAHRSFQIRLLDIVVRVLSVMLAVLGLFFVLYLAEDWFLLSLAIIFFLGLLWTVRQGLPRLWQQGRLLLNIGSVREKERLYLHGVPWRVESINVFSKLVNPSLGVELRVPVEDLVGLVSRPFKPEEPWFPCKKGDWVVVGDTPRCRVVSLSHEYVEVVERGGKRILYPTDEFLQACPVNLSCNFRIRACFGLSYDLQEQITSTIPLILKDYLSGKIQEEGYQDNCLSLLVEFQQANSSSLDLIVLADFDGRVAEIYARLERAIQRWCVDCCTTNHWGIPFPQLTVHRPD